MTDRFEADELPRETLEAWTVPAMPEHLEERVLVRIQEHWSAPIPAATEGWAPRTAWRRHLATTVAVVAVGAAAAAALVLAISRPQPSFPPLAPAVGGQAHAPAHLTISVVPPDASVEIDGRAIDGPSPFVATNIAAGKHLIRVHRAGHTPWTRELDVPSGPLNVPVILGTIPDAGGESSSLSGLAGVVLTAMFETKPVGNGRLAKDEIRKVVATHIDEIRGCYNEGLARDPSLAGKVVVTFKIVSDGAVKDATVTESSLADATVGKCMVTAVGRWRFPAPEGGSVVVTYPFVLEPG